MLKSKLLQESHGANHCSARPHHPGFASNIEHVRLKKMGMINPGVL